MCCGNDSAPVVTVNGEPEEAVPADTTQYVVTYFNGTQETVTGIDQVRQRVINPASRAEGTDRDGHQGATYHPAR